MGDPDEDGYKYLGILELDRILQQEMKSKTRAAYFKRLKLLLKSKLNSRNLFLAINSWAVALIRYGACVLDWTKEEIDEIDRKTQKMLTIYGAFHPKSNINRLYLKRKSGGRGLISINDCIEGEIRNVHEYLTSSEESLLKFVVKALNIQEEVEGKNNYQKRKLEEKMNSLKNMKLHGQFQNDTENIKQDESWDWLSRGDLKRETESLLMAAQEQALNTNSVKKNIYHTAESDKCRICGTGVENVTHIISQCSSLANKEYLSRHDKVCLNIHWALCNKYQIPCVDKWYEHIPPAVSENENVKILWNPFIQTDRTVQHNHPDIVVFCKEKRHCQIVDVAIPGDRNIVKKQAEKLTNYADLKIEISKMWDCSTVVIPIVIGALGSIPQKLEKYLEELDIKSDLPTYQKSALLGTANILRKVLSIKGP